jgi:hypothetical protein
VIDSQQVSICILSSNEMMMMSIHNAGKDIVDAINHQIIDY